MNGQFNSHTLQAAPQKPAAPAFKASNLRPLAKNTLVGIVDVKTPGGFVFRGLLVHQKNEKKWVQVPSKEFRKTDGSRGFTPIVEFSPPARFQAFNAACLAAIDKLLAEGSEQ